MLDKDQTKVHKIGLDQCTGLLSGQHIYLFRVMVQAWTCIDREYQSIRTSISIIEPKPNHGFKYWLLAIQVGIIYVLNILVQHWES